MEELSILIPARNEMFLARTIQDILDNSEADTEIITVLDGQWADPGIPVNPKVEVIYHNHSIGQRAATNEAARVSSGKYIMKVDAHCAFDKGFDRVLLEDIEDDMTIVPIMRNLHAFDWICKDCDWRQYQGPTPEKCGKCGSTNIERDIVWIAKNSPQSTSYCFDTEPHFQYFNDYIKRVRKEYESRGEELKLSETMSLQGSCFMTKRENYFDLNLCDENFGSWGSQGIEVACKTWLSGGRVIVDHRTWYAHMFRTQGGDFGFPYPQSGRQIQNAKHLAKDIFFNNKWPKQVYPLSWLVKKFWPVTGWTDADLEELEKNEDRERFNVPVSVVEHSTNVDTSNRITDSNISRTDDIIPDDTLTKGIIYYTDNRLDDKIMNACQEQLEEMGLPIVSASLKPINFGQNIVVPLERGYLTMFKQILLALEVIEADVIYFCEHDVLYHVSHFDFIPSERDKFYYNTNVWKVDYESGRALHYDCQQTSGLCAYRPLLLEHYRRRVDLVEKNGFSRNMGFEPGTHNRPQRVDDYKAESWMSKYPNIDIRHNTNLTPSRWRREQFRNQRYTKGWTESDTVEGWGNTKELVDSIRE